MLKQSADKFWLTDENLGDGEPVLEGSIADVGNTSQGPGAPVINTLGK